MRDELKIVGATTLSTITIGLVVFLFHVVFISPMRLHSDDQEHIRMLQEELNSQSEIDNLAATAAENQKRYALMNVIRQEYILGRDNITPQIMAGTEWPPLEWLNNRLAEMGELFRVVPGPNPAQLRFVDP